MEPVIAIRGANLLHNGSVGLVETDENRGGVYEAIIEKVFFEGFIEGSTSFEFTRDSLTNKFVSPKNVGDLIYTFRYRKTLPKSICKTAPANHVWIIEPAGNGRYRFRCVVDSRLSPDRDIAPVYFVDNSAPMVKKYRINDEQSILRVIQTNRMLDLVLHGRLDHLQSHLRTNVVGIGQIEIDDVYVGLDQHGHPIVVPVQAKGGKDQIGYVQVYQDTRACAYKWPDLECRPVAVHYDACENRVSVFEIRCENDQLKVISEHYFVLI